MRIDADLDIVDGGQWGREGDETLFAATQTNVTCA